MTTGEKIAVLRKKNGITQEQMSEMLQVSRQSVSRWEMDAAFPEIGKLVKLSKMLNCSVDFLLNGEIEEPDNRSALLSAYECYRFIRNCSCFFLATSVENKPKVRPMSWICSYDKELYIATDKRKRVYTEILNNPQIELASYNQNKRKWIRITGNMEEEGSLAVYEEMKSIYPLIRQVFIDESEVFFVVFRLNIENIEID